MTTALLGAAALLSAATALALALRLRRAGRRIAELQRAVDEVEHERRQLLAALGHDLRTPLSVVIGYHELLTDEIYGSLDRRAEEAVRRIGTSAHQLLALLDAILDLSRLERGRVRPHAEIVPLDALLAEAIDAARPFADERDTRLEVATGPMPTITSDPARLRTALDLALAATIRATPGATLRIRTDPDGAVLEVEGTGLGAVASPDGAAPGPETGRRADAASPRPRALPLRLLLAARLLEALGGELAIRPADRFATLRLRFPQGPPTSD